MNSASTYLVIMAGGSGTRFWPKSTSRKPKQLLSFGDGDKSLLVETLERFDGIVPAKNRIIVTTQALQGAVAEQVSKDVTVLAEPQGRNTAPCVYWAARAIAERDPNAVMLVMPADHYIPKVDAFKRTLGEAMKWAQRLDDLVTLGVKPSRPETGYGYLKLGKNLKGEAVAVEAFVEKPNLEKAREFFKGGYLWNGGMFVWRAEVILKAFDQSMPEMKKAWDSSEGKVEAAYPKMTATSIDYGVMEKARNVVTFVLDCGWDDLGSWTSLEGIAEVLGAQKSGGVVTSGEVLAVDSSGNIVDAPKKLVALLGVRDLIVVESGDAILIADKSRAQDIRQIVDGVKKIRPELA
ncbi:NTP transferase domain-containing protein [bacterium]|nr:NTP transferase domain-containing protein [bacterium]